MVLGAAVEQWLAVQSSVAVCIFLSTNGGIPHPSPPPYFSRVMQSSSSTEQLRHALCLSVGRRVAVAEVLRRGVRSELRDANVSWWDRGAFGNRAAPTALEGTAACRQVYSLAAHFTVTKLCSHTSLLHVFHSYRRFPSTKCVMDYLTHHATMVHKTSG